MAFCGKCGSTLADGAVFCGKCGSPVGQPAADAGVPPPPPQFTPPAYSGPVSAPGLTTRITNILTKPKLEWPVIERETTTVAGLYTGYIAILAAIPAIAMFIGWSLIGIGIFKISIGSALLGAILQYVLSLAGAYISALIIDKLAPSFQSQPNFIQALKLVAYASTASWLAGIFGMLPVLSFLGIIGLYSIYLFYVGLPVMMKTPQDKVIVYMIVSAVIMLVVYVVIGLIVSAIIMPSYPLPGVIG